MVYNYPVLKKRPIVLSFIPLLLLSSCNKKVGEELNAQKNGLGLFQYGEVVGKAYSSTDTFSSYCISDDGSKIIEAIENRENVFVLQTAKDCSHCQKLMPRLCEFLSLYPVKTFLIEAPSLKDCGNVKSAFEKIGTAYPSLTFKLEFPRATTISSTLTETSFLFSGYTASVGDMCNLLLNQFHTENILYFEKEASFANYLKENGTSGYAYSSLSSFMENDKKDILGKSKNLAICPSSTLNEGYYAYNEGLVSIDKEEALKLL
ncbi:MAG: hypothetical protein K6B65_03035 [Bacilli bacterium]|nr:hypothetical protein [Bacilli bacterium]